MVIANLLRLSGLHPYRCHRFILNSSDALSNDLRNNMLYVYSQMPFFGYTASSFWIKRDSKCGTADFLPDVLSLTISALIRSELLKPNRGLGWERFQGDINSFRHHILTKYSPKNIFICILCFSKHLWVLIRGRFSPIGRIMSLLSSPGVLLNFIIAWFIFNTKWIIFIY